MVGARYRLCAAGTQSVAGLPRNLREEFLYRPLVLAIPQFI